jgi:hypothetical protein
LLVAIRAVNLGLQPERRLRVLAGDTPVDWARIEKHEDWVALGENNISFAEVINERVLDRKSKALVVFGSNHVTKNGDRYHAPNTTTRVARAHPGSICVVHLFGPPMRRYEDLARRLSGWKPPCLYYPLRGSWLGQEEAQGGDRLGALGDALLYIGPHASCQLAKPPASKIDKPITMKHTDGPLSNGGHTRFLDNLLPGEK